MRIKKVLGTLVILALLGVGVFVFYRMQKEQAPSFDRVALSNDGVERTIIGTSVEGREIEAYTHKGGETHLLFVGGIHGGYEWNSVLLAYTFIDYVNENPNAIPPNITVSIVPSVNPDGVYKIIGKEGRFAAADVPTAVSGASGRFNARNVDLNRNFDCNWKPEGVWRGRAVSAGAEPFSEPETAAFRDFVLQTKPDAVIFWHSQANAVYPGECGGDISQETRNIMNVYAQATGYQALDSFDAYEVTGSADGWLALRGIPALTVELETHETIEWERNLAGINALFEYYSL